MGIGAQELLMVILDIAAVIAMIHVLFASPIFHKNTANDGPATGMLLELYRIISILALLYFAYKFYNSYIFLKMMGGEIICATLLIILAANIIVASAAIAYRRQCAGIN